MAASPRDERNVWSRHLSRWRTRSWATIGVMVVVSTLAALGCRREAEPPALLGFEPPTPSVHIGESQYIRIMYDSKDARLGNFSWTVEAGAIIGDGLSAVIYKAPQTPGTYRISVAVTYGFRQDTVSFTGTIQVLPAPAPPPPPASDVVSREETERAEPDPDTRSVLDEIVQQGRFTAVVYQDFPPFSFLDAHGTRVGFDVDLMREFARRWLGDDHAVTLEPVESGRRIPTLLEGKAEIIAAALTQTPARQHPIGFSHIYFKGGQRLLVPAQSEITEVCDLHEKIIAVTKGSTAVDNVQAQVAACDIAAELIEVEAHSRGVDAVLTGQADTFSTDGLTLEHWAAGKPLKVVGEPFSEERYGLGVPKGDADFLRLVNLTLEVMYADGTFAALYHKWFQDGRRPDLIPFIVSDTADPALVKLAHTDLPPLFPPIPESVPPAREYTVQRGDSLSRIARKVYGDASSASWKRIYAANKAVIGPDPSQLLVGTRLIIPAPL